MEIKTPHINALENSFAKTVLMPGDPLRSKFIAENYLENAVLINNVRGVQGYTGTYKGVKISVMASGMGMPSMGIYSYELFNVCNVNNIIRIGSAGTLDKNIDLKSIVVAKSALTNTNYNNLYQDNIHSINCSELLLEEIKKLNANCTIGNIYSTDTFYNDKNQDEFIGKALAVEMETAALYDNAKKCNKNAIALLTISDNLITHKSLTTEERQSSFTDMIELALKLAIRMDKNV